MEDGAGEEELVVVEEEEGEGLGEATEEVAEEEGVEAEEEVEAEEGVEADVHRAFNLLTTYTRKR